MLNQYNSKINFISLIGIAFFIPISRNIIPFIILIWGLNWLFIQNYKEKFQNLKKNFLVLFLLSALFFLYLTSLLYTSNKGAGWFDIEVKLSLFLFPLIIFSYELPSKEETRKIFTAFVAGCLTTVVLSFVHSIKLFFETKEIASFIYTNFSFVFHPSYFSLYLNFAIIIIMFFLFEKEKNHTVEKPLYIFLIILFSISIVLTNSKAVIFTLIITYISGVIYYLKKNIYFKISFLSLFVFLLVVFIYKTPQLYNRISESEKTFDKYFHNEELRDLDGTSQRILAWKCSFKLIKENFLIGVGAGDVKDELIKEYFKKDYYYLVEKKLNSHNQLLQTFVATGVLGLLLLIMMFILPIIKGYKHKNFVYFSFLLIVFINFLAESMLETQAGVIFFAFFNSYLFAHNSNRV